MVTDGHRLFTKTTLTKNVKQNYKNCFEKAACDQKNSLA